jgi:hypothetical protein
MRQRLLPREHFRRGNADIRRLAVRYERRADICEAFHHLAAAVICARFVERWFC